MAKKVVTSTRHVGDLETPRNSFDLPVETSYGLYAGTDSKLYSCRSIKESSEKNCCPIEAPMKKLISEEISKRSNTRQNAPSIVARLMGVDTLPADLGQAPLMVRKKNETPVVKLMDKEQSKKGSLGHDPYMVTSSPQWDLGSFDYNSDSYSDLCSSHMKMRKLKPREHPQEEQLQKFKKEFEAWQAARFKECSKAVQYDNAPHQLVGLELNKETKSLYADSRRIKIGDNLMEPKDITVQSLEMLTSHNWGKKKDYLSDEVKESLYSSTKSRTDIQTSQFMNSDQILNTVSSPTKIVILRPGPDRMGVSEDSWNSTPSTLDERGSILDFLEEVKERLKSELQGKSSKRCATVRGGGVETPYREKPSEPRQIAQRIAQQVRDSVTRDFGMNLLRSESTRSYRSDSQLNGTGSPEFSKKDTRRFLTERLSNALRGETQREVSTVSHKRQKSSVLDYEKSRAGLLRDVWTENKMGCCESFMNDIENQSSSFRQDHDDGRMHYRELSPGSLVRSLSAPVSGNSFGKLLLEDRHILTGAQIRMKHEVVENVSMNGKKQKKDKFNIREKVSNFGYRLTLRGRLFRRRVQSVDGLNYDRDDLFNDAASGLHYDRDDLFKDVASGPTVVMSSYETHENSTEVPPSPASVCSSVGDEFWRAAVCSSPPSPGDKQLEDSKMPDVFIQINSNSNNLQRELNQLESTGLEEPVIEEQPHEVETEIEDPAEAYIRDLLVASDYYNGSCNRSLSKRDLLGKPISSEVFEEVEEAYRQSNKVDESSTKDQESRINHRMIFDLLNEALPNILRQPKNTCRLENTARSVYKPPQGRELLYHIWEILRVYVHPPQADRSYYALDIMLAQDLKSDSWLRLMDDDIDALGKDLGVQITSDLIEEIVEDMYL